MVSVGSHPAPFPQNKQNEPTVAVDPINSQIVIGGSNDVANLFPEREAFPNRQPGFRVKDRLENRVHDLVCAGEMTLSGARRQVAADWEALYGRVFGAAPSG